MTMGPNSVIQLRQKAEEIALLLAAPEVDLWKLRELALTEGGLVNDSLRKKAWPKLVGLTCVYEEKDRNKESARPRPSSRDLPPRMPQRPRPQASDDASVISIVSTAHSEKSRKRPTTMVPCSDDADQIDRDVARCTWHLLIGSQRSRRLQIKNKRRRKMAALIRKKQKRLGNLLNLTLLHTYTDNGNEKLNYYQGYHDIASIFLSALGGGAQTFSGDDDADSLLSIAGSMGLDLPCRVLAQLSRSHFRDAMRSNFIELQTALKISIFPLISAFDTEVHDHLWKCDMAPFFCLSWILTWFSHDIRDTALVTRLFDAFLVSHPLLPIYVSVAMICHPINRAEILNTECDFSELHQTLAALPKNSCMVGWIYRAGDGYVSGEDDEDGTASTDIDVSFLDDDTVEGRDDEESETQSLVVHMANVGKEARVPFQDLIDTAISYMRRIPPRKLLVMAKRYYDGDETMQPMMSPSHTISLLQSPPRWALLATLPADWVLKQKLRKREGRPPTKRLRRRSRSGSISDASDEMEAKPEMVSKDTSNKEDKIEKYLKDQEKSLAVIACGFGPCDDDEFRLRRRTNRKILMWSGIAIVVVAISVAVAIKYGVFSKRTNPKLQRSLDDGKRASESGPVRNDPDSQNSIELSRSHPNIAHVSMMADGTTNVQPTTKGSVSTLKDDQKSVPIVPTKANRSRGRSNSNPTGTSTERAKMDTKDTIITAGEMSGKVAMTSNPLSSRTSTTGIRDVLSMPVDAQKPTKGTSMSKIDAILVETKAEQERARVFAQIEKATLANLASDSLPQGLQVAVKAAKLAGIIVRETREAFREPDAISHSSVEPLHAWKDTPVAKTAVKLADNLVREAHDAVHTGLNALHELSDTSAAKEVIKLVGDVVKEAREAFDDPDAMSISIPLMHSFGDTPAVKTANRLVDTALATGIAAMHELVETTVGKTAIKLVDGIMREASEAFREPDSISIGIPTMHEFKDTPAAKTAIKLTDRIVREAREAFEEPDAISTRVGAMHQLSDTPVAKTAIKFADNFVRGAREAFRDPEAMTTRVTAVHGLIDTPMAKTTVKVVESVVREAREAFQDPDAVGEL